MNVYKFLAAPSRASLLKTAKLVCTNAHTEGQARNQLAHLNCFLALAVRKPLPAKTKKWLLVNNEVSYGLY